VRSVAQVGYGSSPLSRPRPGVAGVCSSKSERVGVSSKRAGTGGNMSAHGYTGDCDVEWWFWQHTGTMTPRAPTNMPGRAHHDVNALEPDVASGRFMRASSASVVSNTGTDAE
jgi:hypothetical protein